MRSAEESGALYADVALVIAESRQPGLEGGDKGWGPGPHWPVAARRGKAPSADHTCRPEQKECAAAAELRAAASELGRRGLPLSLEVLAVGPACPLGAGCPGAHLLELWRLHSLDGQTTRKSPLLQPPFLFNALVSHLHFSQLSAWLTTTQGKLPFKIVHRALLHGEESLSEHLNDETLAQLSIHEFPETATASQSIKVRVSSLPRDSQSEVPRPECDCASSTTSATSPSTSSASLLLPLGRLPSVSPPPPTPSPPPTPPPPLTAEPRTPQPLSRSTRTPRPPPTILLSCDEPSTSTSYHTEGVTFQVGEQIGDLSEEEDGDLEHGSRLDDWESQCGEECIPGPSTSATYAPWRKSSFTEGATGAGRPRHRAFHAVTGLPLHSSPAPLKRTSTSRTEEEELGLGLGASTSGCFAYDAALRTVAGLRAAFRNERDEESGSSDSEAGPGVGLAKSAPASTSLLGSFEECALRGRLQPFGSLADFRLDLAASGAFCPPHISLPVTAFFFRVSEDDAPSPYLGHCSLDSIGKKGYHIPKKGVFQATLFNPQGTVVKMFVCRYDLSAMPPAHTTFLRQRTFFMPSNGTLGDALANRAWLRYLIHLRLATSRSGKLYLHSDIRLLFSRKADVHGVNEEGLLDSGGFELRSFTEFPSNPRYSPRRLPKHSHPLPL